MCVTNFHNMTPFLILEQAVEEEVVYSNATVYLHNYYQDVESWARGCQKLKIKLL